MKKTLALLLALSMLLSILASCGSTSEAVPGSSADTVVAAESATEEVTEAEALTEADASTAESAAPEAVVEEEPVEEIPVIPYPVGDGSLEFSTWVSADPEFLALYDEWESACVTLPHAEEAVGVTLDVTTVSIFSAFEQYSLMFASGEYPDFVNMGAYSGGVEQAFADDVIIELTEEMLDTYMPNYQAYKKQLNKATMDTITSDGKTLEIYALTDKKYQDRGMVVRGDWLEELGLEVPTTLDELTDMLYLFHNTYGTDRTWDINGGGVFRYSNDAFDTYILDVSKSDPQIFVKDGKVCTPLNDDNYRAYIEWFLPLYNDGVINKNFITDGNTSTNDVYGLVAEGRCAFWESRAEIIENVNDHMEVPITPVPLANITDDGVNNWAEAEILTDKDFGSVSITTCCEEPELLMQVFNYFFTDEGIIMANYGVEDITYTVSDTGEYEYTELLTESELVFSSALTSYCVSKALPYWSYQDRKWLYSSDAVVGAINAWSEAEKSVDREYPGGASLSAEQTSEVTVLVADIMTYATEQMMKFLTGVDPLNDDTWNAYLAHVESMGLNDVLDVYQSAYDAYLAAE